ncbi:MAG: 30S ribosomal protein S15 [Planctomycetota bacterium]
MTTDRKAEIIKEFGGSESNTGSTEVQIALLTDRINYLTEHLKTHRRDNHSRRGLLKLVTSRAKLLKYLARKNIESYRALTDKLGIRRKY